MDRLLAAVLAGIASHKGETAMLRVHREPGSSVLEVDVDQSRRYRITVEAI